MSYASSPLRRFVGPGLCAWSVRLSPRVRSAARLCVSSLRVFSCPSSRAPSCTCVLVHPCGAASRGCCCSLLLSWRRSSVGAAPCLSRGCNWLCMVCRRSLTFQWLMGCGTVLLFGAWLVLYSSCVCSLYGALASVGRFWSCVRGVSRVCIESGALSSLPCSSCGLSACLVGCTSLV